MDCIDFESDMETKMNELSLEENLFKTVIKKNGTELEESLKMVRSLPTFDEFLHPSIHGFPSFIDCKHIYTVRDLKMPVGIGLLPNSTVAVSSKEGHKVKIFNSNDGKFIRDVNHPFQHPSDIAVLPDGRFAVRDDNGLQLFDEDGGFLRDAAEKGCLGRTWGLATDGLGRLFTINTNPTGRSGGITEPGGTEVLIFDVSSAKPIGKVDLGDILDKNISKCRFIAQNRDKLLIVDLGADLVHVYHLSRNSVKSFGGSGKDRGKFKDPAGIVGDRKGNLIVADSRNHRCQVFGTNREYLGQLRFEKPIFRPSAIAVDMHESAIYVLNLWKGGSMAKYEMQKP